MTMNSEARKRATEAETATSASDQRPASPNPSPSATATPVGPHGANLDVAAIRARVEAATPGPWRWDSWRDDLHHLIGRGGSVDTYEYDVEVIEPEHAGECGCRSACHLTNEVREADREFIAHARTDIPALLAELDRVTAALAAERARVARVEALADDPKRHLVRWIDDSHLVDLAELRDNLAATDPAPDEALANAWDEAINEAFAGGWMHDFGADDVLARNPYRTPTPPTVAPSDLPVATGFAASEGDEHDHEWTRCGTCPHPGEPCPCSGSDCPDCPAPVHADDTDAGDEGVRLTEDEREALLGDDLMFANMHASWAQTSLFTAVERILSARLAEAREKYAEIHADWWEQCRITDREASRADAAEARLGEGVVEWGVRWPAGEVDGAMDEKLARGIVLVDPVFRTLVTRTIHTSPWTEVERR